MHKRINSNTLFDKFFKHAFLYHPGFLQCFRHVFRIHDPRSSFSRFDPINIFGNLHTNFRVEMESHLCDWLRATILDFGFEESPIDPFLHTRKDETPDSVVRFETLLNRIIVQTNSKIDENDSVHVFINF